MACSLSDKYYKLVSGVQVESGRIRLIVQVYPIPPPPPPSRADASLVFCVLDDRWSSLWLFRNFGWDSRLEGSVKRSLLSLPLCGELERARAGIKPLHDGSVGLHGRLGWQGAAVVGSIPTLALSHSPQRTKNLPLSVLSLSLSLPPPPSLSLSLCLSSSFFHLPSDLAIGASKSTQVFYLK